MSAHKHFGRMMPKCNIRFCTILVRGATASLTLARHVRQAELQRQKADLDAAAAERLAEATATKARAKTLLEEQRDEVKRMNQMILHSKCATIRDTQVCSIDTILLQDGLHTASMLPHVLQTESSCGCTAWCQRLDVSIDAAYSAGQLLMSTC